MRIETERMKEREATAELIRQLVRDDTLRGEFMILSDETDDENFVQVACDYDDIGGKSDGHFDLEYRTGHGSPLSHCTSRVGADDVERVFLDALEGRVGWRQDFSWEHQDLCGGFSTPRLRDLSRSGRILCVIGCAVGVLFSIIFLVHGIEELISVLRKPGTTPGDFVGAGVFALVPAIILGGGLIQFVKWFRTRGKKREAHERTIPQEGVRLRRVLPTGLAFLGLWCIGWNAATFSFPKIMGAPAGSPESRLEGSGGSIVFGVVFPLIGIAMTMYFLWLLWKHLRPSYEVRLAGGVLKEGENVPFEYRFKGDVEKVERVSFATAWRDMWPSNALGKPPGNVNDEKEFTNPLEIASGSVTLEMPRIAKTCHENFKYYFRATVTFKSGLSVASSYRIPLN